MVVFSFDKCLGLVDTSQWADGGEYNSRQKKRFRMGALTGLI
jgi:hypothetical protein